MQLMRLGLRGVLMAVVVGSPIAAWATPYHRQHGGPPVFNRDSTLR